MIVYVETNFVLELAREQEQAISAKKILELAQDGKLELAFPSFSLSEAFSTIKREQNERNDLFNSLVKTLKELQRSEPHTKIMVDLGPVLVVLKEAVQKEFEPLHSIVGQMLHIGGSLETDETGFWQAVVYQRQFNLQQQDSIIYSAIITDLQRRTLQEAKCFLSLDNRAFASNPRIKSELKLYNCLYFGNVQKSLSFIQHAIQ